MEGVVECASVDVADDEQVDVVGDVAGLFGVAGRPGSVDEGFLDPGDLGERLAQDGDRAEGEDENRPVAGRRVVRDTDGRRRSIRVRAKGKQAAERSREGRLAVRQTREIASSPEPAYRSC